MLGIKNMIRYNLENIDGRETWKVQYYRWIVYFFRNSSLRSFNYQKDYEYPSCSLSTVTINYVDSIIKPTIILFKIPTAIPIK